MNGVMNGVYIGIVESNTLDNKAKIRIKIPEIMGNTILEARIATLLAGDKYGSLFLPEKNDQVLVAFERGCGDDPVIIGSIWGTKSSAPDPNSNGKNDLKVIKTRGGNEIRLVDEKGNEKIEIINEHKDGNKTIESKIIIERVGNKITIDSPDGEILITGKIVTIVAKEELTISSKEKTINIEAKGDTTIKGKLVDINP